MAVCHPFRATLTSRSISACRERTLFRSVLANGLGSLARKCFRRDYAAQPSDREKSQQEVWRMTKTLSHAGQSRKSPWLLAAIECCLAHLAHHCKRPSGSLRLPRPSACSHSEHGRTRLRVSVRALRLPCRLPPVTRYDARGVVMSCVLQLTSFMRCWRESGTLSDRYRHKNLAGVLIFNV
jgi:hypothetical protein